MEENLDGTLHYDGWVKGSGYSGKYKRLGKECREKLSAPLHKDAIQRHPNKTYLSTIKQIFITERLNDTFGIGGWEFEHTILGIYDNSTFTKEKAPKGKVPNVVVTGRLYSKEFDLYTPFQYGGGDIDGLGTDPSDGFKGAVTDCMSKCASLWEIGIQVFKGKPQSQEGNVSQKVDENDHIAELLKDSVQEYSETQVIEEITYTSEYLRVNFPTKESLFVVLKKIDLDPKNIEGDEYDDYISAILNTQESAPKKVEVKKPAPKKEPITEKEVKELSSEAASDVISMMVGWDKLIPPLSQAGKRAVSKQKLVYDQLTKVGVNDANCAEYIKELRLDFDDKKHLCLNGSKDTIVLIAEMHKDKK